MKGIISHFDTALNQFRETVKRITELLSVTPTDPPVPNMQRYRFVVDLGSDPRRKSLNPFSAQSFMSMNNMARFEFVKKSKRVKSPVDHSGLYFEIEAYLENSAPPTSTSTSTSTNTPSISITKSEYQHRSTVSEYQHRSTIPNDLRRQKSFSHVLIDGGHFEALLQACHIPKKSINEDIIAVGIRIKVDIISSLLLKTEEKKIESDLQSRKNNKKISRNYEKEKERTADTSTSIDKNLLNGTLDAFLRKNTLPPDVVVMISNTEEIDRKSTRLNSSHRR